MDYQRKGGNVGARTFGAAILLAGGRVAARLFSLLNLVVLARMLSPTDYGIVALAFTVIALIFAVCETGTGTMLMVEDDLSRPHLDTAFTIHVLRGAFVSVVLVAGAYPLANLLETEALAPVFIALALTPLIGGFANPGIQIYSRNLDFSREVARDVSAAAIASLCAIAAALYFRNYWALVVGAIASSIMQASFTYWRIPFRPRFGLSEWRSFASFGKWIMAERIIAQVTKGAPQIVFWAFSTPAALGIYTIAKNLQSIPLSETLEPLKRSLLPGLATFGKDRDGLRRAFRKAQAVLAGFALPIGVAMAVAAPEIILVMVGPEWLSAIIILQILSPFLALKAAIGPVTNIALLSNGTKAIFTRAVAIACLTYPILAFGIWRSDLTGAAVALAALAIIKLWLHAMMAKQMIGEPVFGLFGNAKRSFAAAICMAAAMLALPQISTLFVFDAGNPLLETAAIGLTKCAIGMVVYLGVHFALWFGTGKPDGFESALIRYGTLGWTRARQILMDRRGGKASTQAATARRSTTDD
ncbi:MAG: lipopolysaccharide biosynthesis protein [Pontixanthobacter sp.]